MIKHLNSPFQDSEEIRDLRVGDIVYLSGSILTMRDSAHDRLFRATDQGEKVEPLLKNAVVWHCGPVVKDSPNGWEITSAGSTTSYRFSGVTPRLLDQFGVKALIGKGGLGPEAVSAISENGAVFLSTVGGCAGLYARHIIKVNGLYWPELGLPEAIWDFQVKNMGALVVTIDSTGSNLYGKTMTELGDKLLQLYDILKIFPEKEYVYWPPVVPGLPAVRECFKNHNKVYE